MLNAESASPVRAPRDTAREVQALLWVAAAAAWAMVAIRAWSQNRKLEARRKTFSTSDRLLKQVFPATNDAHSPSG